ncbi:MAG: hypothetical protein HYY06_12465 [Deltaproteobacteria bacterium]|nr:hypothetical protein [Deltaproteobacteria bacterium]
MHPCGDPEVCVSADNRGCPLDDADCDGWAACPEGSLEGCDCNDGLHIAFYDTDSDTLRYGSNRSGTWRFEEAHQGDGDDTGLDPSIAVGSNGGVGIAFSDPSGDLMFAYRDPPDGDQNCDGYDP